MSSKVVFLMRELSGYFVSCIQHWKGTFEGEVYVVYWPIHQDAPFQWQMDSSIHWMEKSAFLQSHNQDLFWQKTQHLFVAGWGDGDYNGIVKGNPDISKTILFDTQWTPSLKMHLGRFWLYFKIIRHFESAWVPGKRQRDLATKLFFKSNQIFSHFYVGDQLLFDQPKAHGFKNENELNIVFAGRLIHEKGILPLIQQFIETMNDEPLLNWHLHICGTGPLSQDCPSHSRVTYHGFVQPKDLAFLFQRMDIFVLPSLYEPWGVVVHEAAFSGLPLLVSDAVGAADDFVVEGMNGWVFSSGDVKALMVCIRKFNQLSGEEKQAMSEKSRALARSVVMETWAISAHQILKEKSCAE
jgi:glycosyltransferase involved in cell wall biosynthesis